MAAPQDSSLSKSAHDLNRNAHDLNNTAHEPNTLCYHPAFSSEADIVLQSAEGTLYRIHSYTLRTTSGLFRTMLSLPPPTGGHMAEPIAIHEPDAVADPLLRLMCGLATDPWHSYDQLESVVFLAEKWDAPGPLAAVRTALSGHRWLTAAPLRIYALAAHFGWRAELALASKHTLALDLFTPVHAETLSSLPPAALLALLRLHRGRRDALRTALDSPERFVAGNGDAYMCAACAVTPLENHTWRALKTRVFREMDCRPDGEALGVPVGGMCDWPETRACWAATCVREGCGAANYDRVGTLKQIRACVDALPVAVDVDEALGTL
ncbi:hypothetical protein C8R44DRAFT_805089 [Mycena epipterygia]|nr:hypothetical protein C8R44DRAFT_805089 [Mycena epipterygia]